MSKCSSSGEDFVKFVFSPCVATYVSADVNDLCTKLNLTFPQLLKPFSQLDKDVSIRDSNSTHTVCKLRLNFVDSLSSIPHDAAKNALRWVVKACSEDNSLPSSSITNGSLSVCIPASAPWFEAWRYIFFKSLRPSAHEFLDHCQGCLFVVSTINPNPVSALSDLCTLHHEQQQQLAGDSVYPRWFLPSVAKYFVLLHDESQFDQPVNVSNIYAQVERIFGSGSCYLLTLHTDTHAADDSQQHASFPNGTATIVRDPRSFPNNLSKFGDYDPWLNHLLPHGCNVDTVNRYCSSDHALPPSPKPTICANDPLSRTADEEESHLLNSKTVKFGSENDPFITPQLLVPHGCTLSQLDHEKLRVFVYEFVVCCLLPWVEQTMRNLNDQIAHRMRLTRSFFSATKKLFSSAVGVATAGAIGGSSGGGSASYGRSATSVLTHSATFSSLTSPNLVGYVGSGGHLPAVSSETVMARNTTGMGSSREDVRLSSPIPSTTTVVVYASDSLEMQMRRLADLAFLYQQYEVAHQLYTVLKRDFQNDAAWLYYAGAQEMSALSIFMQGSTSQRHYPYHYIDSAVTVYLQTYQSSNLALRATLLNAEALCSRGLFSECAMNLFRLTSEDDDLTSALLIEQAAYCVLKIRRPMIRKFAFRIALAGLRYGRAKEANLAIRCFKQAHPILAGRHWGLAEDHINYNIGLHAHAIGDVDTSIDSLRQNLTRSNRQSVTRQEIFVRKFLTFLRNGLSNPTYLRSPKLPLFPVPSVRWKDIKTMLGEPTKLFNETIVCQLPVINPLRIPLVFTGLQLLWCFQPSLDLTSSPVLSNESADASSSSSSSKQSRSSANLHHFITTQIVPELILLAEEEKKFLINLTVKQPGTLCITGLSFYWASLSHQFSSLKSGPGVVTFDTGDSGTDDTDEVEWNNGGMPGHDAAVLVNKHNFDHPSSSSTLYNSFLRSVNEVSSSSVTSTSQAVCGRINLLGDSIPYDDVDQLISGSLQSPLIWRVTSPAPLLKVYFSDLPSKLLQGQVHRLQLTVTNVGSQPISIVRMASNWPGFVTFGSGLFTSLSENSTYEFSQMVDLTHIQSYPDCFQPPWTVIPFSTKCEALSPGSTSTVPMWLRAPHITNPHRRHSKRYHSSRHRPHHLLPGASTVVQTRTVHMVFQYLRANPSSISDDQMFNSRYVKHLYDLELQPSLRLEAVVCPRYHLSVRDHLLCLRLQNVTATTTRTTFEFIQVSCSSHWWTIQPVEQKPLGPFVIGPTETTTVYLRVSPANDSQSNVSRLSTVSLRGNNPALPIVCPSSTPCAEFSNLSGTNNKYLHSATASDPNRSVTRAKTMDELQQRMDLKLTVIWQVIDKINERTVNPIYGQSHVTVVRLNSPIVVPCDSQLTWSRWKSPLANHDPAFSSPSIPLPQPELIRLRLIYPHHVVHDFPDWSTGGRKTVITSLIQRSPLFLPNPARIVEPTAGNQSSAVASISLPIIPITIELRNSARTSLNITLQLTDDGDESIPHGSTSARSIIDSTPMLTTVQWIGSIVHQIQLSPNQMQSVELKATVPHPGMYRMNNFQLKVHPMSFDLDPQIVQPLDQSYLVLVTNRF